MQLLKAQIPPQIWTHIIITDNYYGRTQLSPCKPPLLYLLRNSTQPSIPTLSLYQSVTSI